MHRGQRTFLHTHFNGGVPVNFVISTTDKLSMIKG